MIQKYRFVLIALFVSVALPLGLASAQTVVNDGGNDLDIPGGIIPDDGEVGPVANVGDVHKFDDGLYQKIQDLIGAEHADGDYGVYDGTRYYDVIIVVSRDDGDARSPDETALENKDATVKRLELLGAKNVRAAESLSFVTASIPVADVPGFSLHDEVYAIGDGEIPVTVEVDTARDTINAESADLRSSVGYVPDGTGIRVAVVDTGIVTGQAMPSLPYVT